MEDESEYVDYELYLDEGFSPIAFANSLVQATNSATDTDVDLDAPAKRLEYDIEEVDKLVGKIAGDNYEQLIQQAEQVSVAKDALNPVGGALEHVNYSYNKLRTDVLKPYENAQVVFNALRRLHATTSLLRSLTWYLYLARQLEHPEQGKDGGSKEEAAQHRAETAYKTASSIKQCQNQLKLYPALRSLATITSHEQVLRQKHQKTLDLALKEVRGANVRTHYARPILQYALRTLNELDQSQMVSTVSDSLPRKVREATDQFVKSLVGLPQSYYNACADAKDRAKSLALLFTVLDSTMVEDDNGASATLLSIVRERRSDFPAAQSSLVQVFWRDVANDFDSRLRDYLKRNESVARSRKKLIPQLKESITSAVVQTGCDPNSLAVKVMVGTFAPWERL